MESDKTGLLPGSSNENKEVELGNISIKTIEIDPYGNSAHGSRKQSPVRRVKMLTPKNTMPL